MVQPEIHRFTQVSSTLDVLHEFAARSAPHGTVLVAEEQVEGRGSRGRTWQSPLGGLWYSILLRDWNDPALEILSIRIGLTVAAILESIIPGLVVGLKWPNDLMLGDRKVGGILCEAHWQSGTLGWIVVGIGLNVANAIPQELVGSATSLGEFVPGLRPDVLISPITKELRALSAGTGGLSAEELLAFRGRDWLLGRELLEPEPGRASGINPDGTLRVTRADGTIAAQRVGHVVLASG